VEGCCLNALYERRIPASIPSKIWETGGLTEHLGGLDATERLLQQCPLTAGLQVLDVGCGTGYTAVHLAESYGARVVALDLNPRSLAEARKRAAKDGSHEQIRVVQADAHELPFRSSTFDVAIVESVLVF
jgi:arsenite methyltransferase